MSVCVSGSLVAYCCSKLFLFRFLYVVLQTADWWCWYPFLRFGCNNTDDCQCLMSGAGARPDGCLQRPGRRLPLLLHDGRIGLPAAARRSRGAAVSAAASAGRHGGLASTAAILWRNVRDRKSPPCHNARSSARLILRARRIPPLFPPAVWNVNDATLTGRERTNNVCEGCNNAFATMVGHHHPSLWCLIGALQQDQAMVATALLQNARGQPPAKRCKR